MTNLNRDKEIAKAIEIVWDSLKTHLPYTYRRLGEHARAEGEANAFHKLCVKEYAEVIKTLADLL